MDSHTMVNIRIKSTISFCLYDVSGYETVVLSYDRWLTVEDGLYDHAVITANGGQRQS